MPDDIPVYEDYVTWYDFTQVYCEFDWYLEKKDVVFLKAYAFTDTMKSFKGAQGFACYLSDRIKVVVSFVTMVDGIALPRIFFLPRNRPSGVHIPKVWLNICELERLSTLIDSIKGKFIKVIRHDKPDGAKMFR